MNNKEQIIRKYEKAIFRYGVILALSLFTIRLIHILIIGTKSEMIGFYALMIVIFGFIYYLQSKKYQLATTLFYAIGTIELFSVWNVYGGWSGSVPYTLFIFTIFIIITSHKWILIGALIFVSLGLLLADHISFLAANSNYTNSSLVIDFIINTIVIISLTYSLKIFFYKEKKYSEKTNTQLSKTNNQLSLQKQLLLHQTEEMNQAKTNQENLVQSTFMEVEDSGKLLQGYNFTNSHIVRAPLSNVLGLINLLEQEHPNHPEIAIFKKIKKEAETMDSLIRDVTQAVNSSRKAS